MKKVTLENVEVDPLGEQSVRRRLAGPLGATDMAINQYRIAPGEELPGGLHAHMDQEEVFAVLEGQATFETMDGMITVDTGELVRFAPGEFQSGANHSNSDLVVMALGAPRTTEDIRIPVDCPECDHTNLRLETSDRDIVFTCPACNTTLIPQDCPECGQADLSVTLDQKGSAVVVCHECTAQFDRPPLESENESQSETQSQRE